MPLNRGQKKKLKAMRKQYGSQRGTRIFYASENKHHAKHMRKRH